jgi:acetyltransferase-like isoleucine patch superfamily enzyme
MEFQGQAINFKQLKAGILGQLATSIWFIPKLVKKIHQIRGVNFKNVNQVFLGRGVFIDNKYPHLVYIGSNVMITGNCIILAHSETTTYHKERYKFIEISKPVFIEDNVFIGAGSIVLPGVKIGYGAYIAAGSVVTKNVENNTIVGGNPAKFIRNLIELETLNELHS